MKRRTFVSLLGGAAWPLAARAQPQPAMPVIGFLNGASPEGYALYAAAFRQGLKEAGYIDGQNVAIEYRWAEGRYERLPTQAADLVHRQVSVIAATSTPAVLVAKAATSTIPIVFTTGADPVKLGFVASLNQPGGNMTGINFFSTELVTKRLEFLRALVPTVTRIAVLVNPSNPSSGEATVEDAQGAARVLGLQIHIHNAQTRQDIDAVFAALVYERADALLVASDTLFSGRRVQLVNLATRHGIPTAFPNREHTEIGGLMIYGSSIVDAWRQAGIHTGRILKGSRPADLPVVQASKFELVINHQTARMLGLTVPTSLLALADEVIE